MPTELRLTVVSGPMQGETFVVPEGGDAVFGRSSKCGVGRLPLADPGIGRRQFLVKVQSGTARLWDLGGTNPTWVNGQAHRGQPSARTAAFNPCKTDALTLETGDRIGVGGTILRVCLNVVGFEAEAAANGAAGKVDRLPERAGDGQAGRGARLRPECRKEMVSTNPSDLGDMRFVESDRLPKVEGYILGQRLGKGLGTSFVAMRECDRFKVALKIIRAPGWVEERALLALRQGLAGLCQFRHPGIASVSDFGIEQGRGGPGSLRICLEAEWCDGVNAQDHLVRRGGRLPFPEIHALLRDCCVVLDAAHDCGLVHHGIKPENMIVVPSKGGMVTRLTDFRLHWLISRALRGWSASESFRTRSLRFMSLRQQHSPESDSLQNDLWALAAVAKYLLTGRMPSADSPRHPAPPEVGIRGRPVRRGTEDVAGTGAELVEFLPPQQNLWVGGGSVNLPSW